MDRNHGFIILQKHSLNKGVRMNTKSIFEKYWDNKASIVLFDSLIDQRKIDLLPAMTPQLSDEPKAHRVESNVEKTVIKWEEDQKIISFKKAKQHAENDVQTVEKLLDVLNPTSRNIIEGRYIRKETIEEIAEKEDLSVSTVKRKIDQTFNTLDKIALYFLGEPKMNQK